MTKLLRKDTHQLNGHSQYFYKTLIFKFLDIGLFEEKEFKKNAYEKLFLNSNLNKKDIVCIVELFKKDPILLEMIRLWA